MNFLSYRAKKSANSYQQTAISTNLSIIKYLLEKQQMNYQAVGLARECYIDGIWNKESPDQWLTEIQLPIE